MRNIGPASRRLYAKRYETKIIKCTAATRDRASPAAAAAAASGQLPTYAEIRGNMQRCSSSSLPLPPLPTPLARFVYTTHKVRRRRRARYDEKVASHAARTSAMWHEHIQNSIRLCLHLRARARRTVQHEQKMQFSHSSRAAAERLNMPL